MVTTDLSTGTRVLGVPVHGNMSKSQVLFSEHLLFKKVLSVVVVEYRSIVYRIESLLGAIHKSRTDGARY